MKKKTWRPTRTPKSGYLKDPIVNCARIPPKVTAQTWCLPPYSFFTKVTSLIGGEFRGLQVINGVRRVHRIVFITIEQSDEVRTLSFQHLLDIVIFSLRNIGFRFQASQKELGHIAGQGDVHFLLCAALGLLWDTFRCLLYLQRY